MNVNLYNLPDEDPDRRIAWLRSRIAPLGATVDAVFSKNGPAPLTSRHTPFFKLIEREAHTEYGSVPVGTEILAASSNDSRFLRARGILCYGMWPFPVDFYQSQGIHSTNERTLLSARCLASPPLLRARILSIHAYSNWNIGSQGRIIPTSTGSFFSRSSNLGRFPKRDAGNRSE